MSDVRVRPESSCGWVKVSVGVKLDAVCNQVVWVSGNRSVLLDGDSSEIELVVSDVVNSLVVELGDEGLFWLLMSVSLASGLIDSVAVTTVDWDTLSEDCFSTELLDIDVIIVELGVNIVSFCVSAEAGFSNPESVALNPSTKSFETLSVELVTFSVILFSPGKTVDEPDFRTEVNKLEVVKVDNDVESLLVCIVVDGEIGKDETLVVLAADVELTGVSTSVLFEDMVAPVVVFSPISPINVVVPPS